MRVPAAILASVAVHGALLLLAGAILLPALQPVDLVRVSLRPGSAAAPGAGESVGPAAPPSVGAAPVAAPLPEAPRPLPPPRRLARRSRPQAASPPAAPAPIADDTVAKGRGVASGDGTGAEGSVGSGSAGSEGSGSGAADGSDQRAFCVYCPEPGYPLIARRRGWQGTVDVRLVLLADGRVDSASVRRSSGYDTLDREAIDVARRSRFRLPSGAATATPIYGRIEYRFELVGPR